MINYDYFNKKIPKLVFVNWENEQISEEIAKKIKCETLHTSLTELLRAKAPDDVNMFLFNDRLSNTYDFIRLREIKQNYPSIPIIITSENRNETRILNAFRMKVWDYVILPLEKNHLMEKIRYYLSVFCKNCGPRRDVIFPAHTIINTQVQEKAAKYGKRTQRALDMISTRYDEPLKIEDLAKLCNISTESFSRNFKKEHGISVRSYLKLCRIAAGKDLLMNTNLSVQQIAHNIGYENISLFNRLFKEIEGVSPNQYRNRLREKMFEVCAD